MHITYIYIKRPIFRFLFHFTSFMLGINLFQCYSLRAFEDDVVLEHNFGNSLCLFTRLRSCWTTF